MVTNSVWWTNHLSVISPYSLVLCYDIAYPNAYASRHIIRDMSGPYTVWPKSYKSVSFCFIKYIELRYIVILISMRGDRL